MIELNNLEIEQYYSCGNSKNSEKYKSLWDIALGIIVVLEGCCNSNNQ